MLAFADTVSSLSVGSLVLLFLAVALALGFELVNGFHDTANAVATVIYTHALPPWVAVIWSGMWNFIGVILSPSGVAFTILALLPTEMVVDVGSGTCFAMIFALLLSAILWNLGTWYLGLPASSTHSLVGAILGVGLANSLIANGHHFGDSTNWAEVNKVFLALLISPVVGFFFAGGLLLLAKKFVKWPELYAPPSPNQPPPKSIRALLIFTCTAVSFGHGSNDGQKGMGLLLLILIGILPGAYALNMHHSVDQLRALRDQSAVVSQMIYPVTADQAARDVAHTTSATDDLSKYIKGNARPDPGTLGSLAVMTRRIAAEIGNHPTLSELTTEQRATLRRDLYTVGATIAKLGKQNAAPDKQAQLNAFKKADLDPMTQFIPLWVKFATAVALGVGTMVGWKRIVVTVGEKIGKTHLTYGQGAAAELVAAATIQLADRFHLPVSTTHVLSSGVAGTMAANRSGLQLATLRNLLLAWVLTLPVCVLLGATLFAAGLLVVLTNTAAIVATAGALIAVGGFAWRMASRKRDESNDMPTSAALQS